MSILLQMLSLAYNNSLLVNQSVDSNDASHAIGNVHACTFASTPAAFQACYRGCSIVTPLVKTYLPFFMCA